ncbi:nucleolar protein 6 [[Candida] jaroonii]|uniref:Nucleolar protein 6 n=1 Tax=[Candida] jaroonii TaxID=467808 RepID=A0ACA9YEH1_9ASCO|nr:nucleolar protein 6 [[Candida] jaroonii]
MSEEKLTKKQRKALEFRKKIEKQEKPVKPTKEPEAESSKRKAEDDTQIEGEVKKKRKTRRGKKGKGVNGGKGPRFILFVGNLPYKVTETELMNHFKNSKPDRIRIRGDKGIAFLEFDNDTKEIQSKMEVALRMHHSMIKDRKINVELTVGGGGNSENRKEKLKQKNEKLSEERKERVVKKKTEDIAGVHPSRQGLIQ